MYRLKQSIQDQLNKKRFYLISTMENVRVDHALWIKKEKLSIRHVSYKEIVENELGRFKYVTDDINYITDILNKYIYYYLESYRGKYIIRKTNTTDAVVISNRMKGDPTSGHIISGPHVNYLHLIRHNFVAA